MKPKLNTRKILNELKRLNHSKIWLAKECGVSRQLLYYWLDNNSLAGVDKIAHALNNHDPKDLII